MGKGGEREGEEGWKGWEGMAGGGGRGWRLPYGNVMMQARRLMVSVAAPVILPLGWGDE